MDNSNLPSSLDSLLTGGNAVFLDDTYKRYLQDPNSVEASWRAIFDQIEGRGRSDANSVTPTSTRMSTQNGESASSLQGDDVALALGLKTSVAATSATSETSRQANQSTSPADASERWLSVDVPKQAAVLRLINSYRVRGHQLAKVDPLGIYAPEPFDDLTLAYNGLEESDLDVRFNTGTLGCADGLMLRDIIAYCEEVYCGPVGSEFRFITDTNQRRWIQAKLETDPIRPRYSKQEREYILERLTAAEGLERYLHTKYVGQKRFSLEGGEALIPMLSDLIQLSGNMGAKEVVIGMAHRGRLNVLVNTLGKSPEELFSEFEGKYKSTDTDTDTGDVKYHQGFSSDILTPGGVVHLALSFNPSHLEIIDPVVEGSVRARQERRGDKERDQVIPILIHGDAAFAGQGVVMETFNMSQCRGYSTGGTIHIVINNQIGFTTSNPLDARSTLYCTEVAKMVQSPIFHVNGDDPDAVIFVTRLALEYRQKFKKDVVVDMVCYRRHGHNEADEPSVTQPIMYQAIKKMPGVRKIYGERLVQECVINEGQPDLMVEAYRSALDQGKVVAGQIIDPNKSEKIVDWHPYIDARWTDEPVTSVSLEKLQSLHAQMQTLPANFTLQARVEKILADRDKMMRGELPMDWGFAENMAYASLIDAGYLVRLSGQDSGRGTFFHRHAVLHDQNSRDTHVPLREIASHPENFLVINSLLSEAAVMGFEYGYATTEPDALVIWEAQFGDFCNGAQVVIDQFISSGESKWSRLCGLTLMLPHGQEGAGPEHSSARVERFLQLCAEQNMQVVIPTTPSQMFHLLRRQMVRPLRKPLIIMSPKSLLRHKRSISTLDDLTSGRFQNVIPETENLNPAEVQRVVLCTGKVYFDLLARREENKQHDVAIIRIEQLHPFPREELSHALAPYKHMHDVVWCQEEPKNQGAWYQIQYYINRCLLAHQSLRYAGREGSPSPAVGYYPLFVEQQSALVNDAMNPQDQTFRAAAG